MPRSAKSVPSYLHHKPTDQAYVRVPDGKGGRRVIYLGKHGSPESQAEYRRILAELEARSVTAPTPAVVVGPRSRSLTVNELLLAFMRWAATHYRTPDGKLTTEIGELKSSLRPVRELYGHTPAAEFGPRALAALQKHMIELGWCRTLINRRIERVKRVFRWATSEELVPVTVYQSLRTLAGLRKGRTDARESEGVKPVDPAHVAATLPFLTPHLQVMVRLQQFTGMRPGEVCRLRLGEVDRSRAEWVYRPTQHKTAHHGKTRGIFIGPRGQTLITGFLLRDGTPPEGFGHVRPNDPDDRDARLVMADAYQEAGRNRDAELLRDTGRVVLIVGGCVVDPSEVLFSPRLAREERFRLARRSRKSKVPPSQQNRRKAMPKLAPADEYTPHTYAHAVRVASRKAGVLHWHPNQLRHTFATEVRREFGPEEAQVLLGHSHLKTTEVYAEKNERLAASVVAKIG